jgi:hypothetical protein
MSHGKPIVRNADLSKLSDIELLSEAQYLYQVGIPEKLNIITRYTYDLHNRVIPTTSIQVPGWKHVEDLQNMLDRLQAISEEIEYRKI